MTTPCLHDQNIEWIKQSLISSSKNEKAIFDLLTTFVASQAKISQRLESHERMIGAQWVVIFTAICGLLAMKFLIGGR